MTVADLIEKLQSFPPHLPVLTEADGLYFTTEEPEVKSVSLAYDSAWQDGEGQQAVVF